MSRLFLLVSMKLNDYDNMSCFLSCVFSSFYPSPNVNLNVISLNSNNFFHIGNVKSNLCIQELHVVLRDPV